jgi:WXG100 family type VII secretion target
MPCTQGAPVTDYIYVSPDAIAVAATDVGDATSQIEALLAGLRDTLTPLEYLWTGNAYDAYQESMASWQTQIGEMNATLSRIHAAAWRIQDNYCHTERDVSVTWA